MYQLNHTLRLCLVLVTLGITQLIYAQEHKKTTVKVADNVYTFSTAGEYISMFVVTDEGVMVFETMNTPHSKAMVEEIKKITAKPIKYAFQSHNHWDHSSGGQVFVDEGATTIAHIEAYDWMVGNPYQDMVLPKESWAGSRKNIELGGVKVELHYLGMNHGLGMTVFLLPDLRLAYIADIVTPNRVIFSVVPDFNIREWERSLVAILDMNFDKAVYSHNERDNRMHGGIKEDVELQLQYIKDLRSGFYSELKKGTNPFLIPKELKLPKYKDWVGYNDWLEMNIWRILADEFMGPYPWRPDHSYENKKPGDKN